MVHCWIPVLITGLALADGPARAQEEARGVKAAAPTVRCSDPGSRDQDDMCIWIHPADPSQSTIIAADKKADKLFVYDLEGKTLQSIPARQPGNIDVRYGFPLGGEKVDIVAFNQRGKPRRILVYKVDYTTRELERVDNNAIRTGSNYGGTLYRSPKSDKFYFLTTSKKGRITQYELKDNGKGRVAGGKVRSWRIGKSEAAVADDERGTIYISDETKGVWEVGAEPGDPTPGTLVIKVGENGLTGDAEGLAIYRRAGGGGYLIVSNQGSSDFKLYQRAGAHGFAGTFAVEGAKKTDGIDVCNDELGPHFPGGLFACHTAEGGCPVLLTPWQSVAEAVLIP